MLGRMRSSSGILRYVLSSRIQVWVWEADKDRYGVKSSDIKTARISRRLLVSLSDARLDGYLFWSVKLRFQESGLCWSIRLMNEV